MEESETSKRTFNSIYHAIMPRICAFVFVRLFLSTLPMINAATFIFMSLHSIPYFFPPTSSFSSFSFSPFFYRYSNISTYKIRKRDCAMKNDLWKHNEFSLIHSFAFHCSRIFVSSESNAAKAFLSSCYRGTFGMFPMASNQHKKSRPGIELLC